jgi:hypothetical protein
VVSTTISCLGLPTIFWVCPSSQSTKYWAREERRAQRQVGGGLVEVALRRRLDAVGAGAEVGAAEVEGEDLLLGVGPLQLHRVEQLLRLALGRAVVGQEQVARQLLGDGRGALRGAALADVGDDGAGDAQGVEAGVLVEAPVLDGHEGGGHIGRQPGEVGRGREPSAAHAQDRPRSIEVGDLRLALDLGQSGQGGRLREQGRGHEQGRHLKRLRGRWSACLA